MAVHRRELSTALHAELLQSEREAVSFRPSASIAADLISLLAAMIESLKGRQGYAGDDGASASASFPSLTSLCG